jgi:hypothetical protein
MPDPCAVERVHKRSSGADIRKGRAHNGGVTAIAWSLVGLMAASLGVLAAALFSGLTGLGSRIDLLGSSLNERIDGLGSSLSARLDAQGVELRSEIRDLRGSIQTLDRRLTRSGG